MLTTRNGGIWLRDYPPRIPPTGFLGLGATPTCVGASARRTLVDESDRVCVVREAFRAIKAQLRADVEAILAFADADLSLGQAQNEFPSTCT